jgi:hypothetical protein
MQCKEIEPDTFHFEFKTQHDLCMTFVRLQEFYESPNKRFRGQYFTLDEYIDWYCVTYNKSFDYMTRWLGFNVPGNIVLKFYNIFYDEFRDKEEELFAVFDTLEIENFDKPDKFYFIGTFEKSKDKSVLAHELRHARFYLNKKYRAAITKAVKQYKLKGLYRELTRLGYTRYVHVDEIQAYVLTGLRDTMIETKEITKLRKSLFEIENKFYAAQQGA